MKPKLAVRKMTTLTCFPWNCAQPPFSNMNWMSKDEQRKKSQTGHAMPFLTYGYDAQCLHVVTTTCKLLLSSR